MDILSFVVLLVLVLPMVYWLARTTAGFGRGASGWLTFIYAISPITGYAVYNVAPGQILAARFSDEGPATRHCGCFGFAATKQVTDPHRDGPVGRLV